MNAPYGYRDLKNAAMDAKLHAREFHAVKDKDDYIVLDIENMRLIRLDKVELRVLTELRRNPIAWGGSPSHGRDPNFDGMLINTADDIEKIETAVEELLQADLVATSPYPAITPAEIEIYTKKLQEEYEAKSIFHISLNVTHKCNLHCVYCYGEDGSYGGPAVNMSEETARQAVDYLFRESGDSEKCSITLFGGEPLLNFPMVRFIINYAREEAAKLNKQIFFQMTTNGLLLDDEKTDYLIEENVGITFSMDGPKHIHDANR
ncbi:MAG: radical SAM protein, partial [bacterium]|nr:radical SAM protein [bacterium]